MCCRVLRHKTMNPCSLLYKKSNLQWHQVVWFPWYIYKPVCVSGVFLTSSMLFCRREALKQSLPADGKENKRKGRSCACGKSNKKKKKKKKSSLYTGTGEGELASKNKIFYLWLQWWLFKKAHRLELILHWTCIR